VGATGISEFTFGYAFLYEQTQRNWTDLKAVPILPSLQQEANLGWDAHLPTHAADFYYQFKLSDYLERPYAKYLKDGTYTTPYYRVSLHRRDNNRQHSRLRANCKSHPDTYYVAPEFSTSTEFQAAFFARSVTENSRLIPLVECDDITDGEQHYLTYVPGSTTWTQHSDPRSHDRSYSGRDLEMLYRETHDRWQLVDLTFAQRLFQDTASVVDRQLSEERRIDTPLARALDTTPESTRAGYLLRTADLLSMYCGVTLVLVGSSPGVK